MQFTFFEQDPIALIEILKKAMGKRELAKIVDFSWTGERLMVTISKAGKTTLEFSKNDIPNGSRYRMEKEKIAFSHRIFKKEVTEKIVNLIEQIGGQMES